MEEASNIDVKFYILRDLNNDGIIYVQYCRSEDQIVDIKIDVLIITHIFCHNFCSIWPLFDLFCMLWTTLYPFYAWCV